ncbi:hypothetical protein B0J17DRAFT_767596 [Rhizoctonia solani]|nr:hypothetical protein B0J17DRAFT_767596 [Rhizoctonia solani]
MSGNHDDTRSELPTPQPSINSHLGGNHGENITAEERGFYALWSVLQNADTNANSQLDASKFAIGEKHIKALVSLSGSLLSMLVRFGDDLLYERSMSDLAEFVHKVMDQCDGRKQAEELAQFLSEHIQGSTSPTVERNTTLIAPEEHAEGMIELQEEENSDVTMSPVSPNKQVSQSVYNRPPLNYDPAPFAKVSARLLSDAFGSDVCPDTVIDYAPTLTEYITDVLSTASIERSIAVYALALLDRLSAQDLVSMPHGTYGLFITAFTIAGKILRDHSFNNKSWAIIGQRVFTLKELNLMERKMCADLQWDLKISVQELEDMEDEICEFEHYDSGVDYIVRQLPLHIPWFPSHQNHSLPPPGTNAVSDNFWGSRFDPTPVAPRTPVLPNPFVPLEVDDSPKWVPLSPCELSLISHYQASINHERRLVLWLQYKVGDYESDEETDEDDYDEYDEYDEDF